jgi:hypothetical protein
MLSLIPIACVVNLLAGFIMGKFHERIEWNKKIQSGAIPAPRK